MPLEIVYRRPCRATFTVYVSAGSSSNGLTQLIYAAAAPCVPDEWEEERKRVFRFFVDGGGVDAAIESLRDAEFRGSLRYTVAFSAAPIVETMTGSSVLKTLPGQ